MVGGGGQKKLSYAVYGYQIAIANSDPSTRVSYPETIFGQPNGAYSVENAAYGTGPNCLGDWDGCNLISGIKRQKGNATTGWTDISNDAAWTAGSGSEDVMTYVPTWYMKMTNDGTNINVAFCETNLDGTWADYAGSVGTVRYGHFRVGCFAATSESSKIYSRGGTPTTNIRYNNCISYAQARGTGYDVMTWYQWSYLTALAVLLYKSTNLQEAMASGNVSSSGSQAETALTFVNRYGMYGAPGNTGSTQMAFFWIQNMWGNIKQFIGGIKTDSNYLISTSTGYSALSGFDNVGIASPFSSGFIRYVTGTTVTGFIPKDISSSAGSTTTFYADKTDGGSMTDKYPDVGGYYSSGGNGGPFALTLNSSSTNAGGQYTTRLSYRL